jgi:hypothetical protein
MVSNRTPDGKFQSPFLLAKIGAHLLGLLGGGTVSEVILESRLSFALFVGGSNPEPTDVFGEFAVFLLGLESSFPDLLFFSDFFGITICLLVVWGLAVYLKLYSF